MNLRLLLALASALTLAGWLASTALAHHPEIRGSVDCQGTVTFTAEAWTENNITTSARTNPDVSVWASTDGGATYTKVGSGHFGSDNGFKFTGTFAIGSKSSVKLRVQADAPWANGAAPGDTRYTTLTKSESCSTPPPPACPAANATVTSSSSIMVTGTTAKVTFTVAAGCKDIELTLVSYKAPGPTFDEKTADQQILFDHKTQLFSAGNWQLDVAVPDCYYQVDFVYGKHIEKLGPAGSNNFYSKQGRLIRAANGGTKACTTSQPPTTPNPPPPPTLTPTPPPVVVPPTVTPPPAVSLVKTERVGGTGAFVRGPVRGKVGQRVFYRLTVTNTGTVPVSATMKDQGCDAGTLKPVGAAVLNPGASFTFTCSHLLKARDGNQYVNVAVVTATAADGAQATATSRVLATVVAGEVLGTQKIVKKKAKPKVKPVTKKAKPAKPVTAGASFTG